MAEKGTPIIGRGAKNNKTLGQAERLSNEYGGSPNDWSKQSSSSYSSIDGTVFETHWYQNTPLGIRVEFKTKLTHLENLLKREVLK